MYYFHESRFDNGQLVDLGERRRAIDKFEMGNPYFHAYYKKAFITMRKGEIAWVVYKKNHHNGTYHAGALYQGMTEEEKEKIGEDVHLRFNVNNIKRNPICKDKNTFKGRADYYELIREVGRDLCEEGEWTNAANLYARSLADIKNMPRKIRDELSEEQLAYRKQMLVVLNQNIALCKIKKGMSDDAIKHSKEVLKLEEKNTKAMYRLAQGYRMKAEFEPAKEVLTKAINIEPNNTTLREEYKSLMEQKKAKEAQWYGKMSGFFEQKKFNDMEVQDEQDRILRERLWNKMQREHEEAERKAEEEAEKEAAQQ